MSNVNVCPRYTAAHSQAESYKAGVVRWRCCSEWFTSESTCVVVYTIVKQGPSFGYHPNPAKAWLIVKEDNLDQATNNFGSSGVNNTSETPWSCTWKHRICQGICKEESCWMVWRGYPPIYHCKIGTTSCILCFYTWSEPSLELCPEDNTKHHQTTDCLAGRSHPTPVDPCNHWPKHNYKH